jgi:uncharacterized protein
MLDEIGDYSHKARILRQIQSNKARSYGRINTVHSVATVVVSALVTFLGFAGMAKLQTYLGGSGAITISAIEVIFNLTVFALFVLVILHLVFHFNKRQADAEAAVVTLTAFINETEDILSTGRRARAVGPQDLDLVRHKYETVIRVIPPNTDREYEEARKDFREKERRKSALQLTPPEIFDPGIHQRAVVSIAQASPEVMQVLQLLRESDSRLYLAGGLVRNVVWDYLHACGSATPIDDVDVVYFDRLSAQKEHDVALENRLRAGAGNIRWSVKNQARMHVPNQDAEYADLNDAILRWPETCTAFALRLNETGQIDIVAPHAFSDLFRLVVRPTPHFAEKPERLKRYQERLLRKKWIDTCLVSLS